MRLATGIRRPPTSGGCRRRADRPTSKSNGAPPGKLRVVLYLEPQSRSAAVFCDAFSHCADGSARNVAARFLKLAIAVRDLTLGPAQTDAGPSTILRNEFHTCFFEGVTQYRNCPFLRRQCARLSFKPLYAGQRYSGCLGEVALLPSEERPRRPNLLAGYRQSNTSGIDSAKAEI